MSTYTTSPNPTEYYHSNYGSFKQLNPTNYQTWKEDVELVLSCIPAMDIVTGDETEPPGGESAQAKSRLVDYRTRSAQAAAVIRFSCTEAMRPLTHGTTDPKKMWDTLKSLLDVTATHIGRSSILQNFENSRPTPNESIVQYIARLQTFRTQLAGTPQAMSEAKFKSHVYTTAPPQFALAIQILRCSRVEPTVEQLIVALRDDEEMRRASESTTAAASGSTLLPSENEGAGPGRGRKRRRGMGHF